MQLMPQESVLLEVKSQGLILTTHRLRTIRTSTSTVTSIMLEEIASASIRKVSQPILLVIAAICAIAGIMVSVANRSDPSPVVVGLAIGAVFVIFYFASRFRALDFASAGGSIKSQLQGTKLEDALAIVDQVEAAKNARYLLQR